MQTDMISLWEKISVRPRRYPELTQDLEVDVAIIGGGITGITTAAQLIKAGKKVAVLEAHEIGGVTTGFSTGNLYIPVQPFYQNIETKFNFSTAKTIAHSRKLAIEYIEKTVHEQKIKCHFTRRSWYAYTTGNPRISLEKEVELFKRMDIPCEYTNTLPFALSFKKAIHLPNQARLNPMQYVISLAAALADRGCLLFEDTRVIEYRENDLCILKTNHAKISAKKVLLATHTPIGINATQLFTAAYRSYVVAVYLQNTDKYPDAHLWDLDKHGPTLSTHAIKTDDPEILMVAGNHHKTGQGKAASLYYQENEAFLRKNFPVAEVAYRWSAQHYQAADDIPYVGLASHHAKHTYLATGYFADGLVYGTLAGIIIADLMLGKLNDLSPTYQSKRCKPLASAKSLAKENMNVFMKYLSDYPLFSSPDFANIKVGEGKVVEINREKYAVSRGENNRLYIVSAVCTHMKCIVNWNDAEKTWDCPCHGSRFTQQGEVIEGPALTHLAAKEILEIDA